MNATSTLPMTHNLQQKIRVDVISTQDQLENWCNNNAIDAVLITAQDAFLSEYTPLQANHRHAVSGFTGSTGDGIFLTRPLSNKLSSPGRFQLFVDGRYHLQADQETVPEAVFVHKFGLATGMDETLFTWIRGQLPAGTRLAVDLQRVGWNRWNALEVLAQEKSLQLKAFAEGQIESALSTVEGWNINRPIETLPENFTGRSAAKNLKELRSAIAKNLGHSNYVWAACMSDDAAWLLNARAYHLPQLSSLLAYVFVTPNTCIVHFPKESETCSYEIPPTLKNEIQIVRGPLAEALAALSKSTEANAAQPTICFSARAMNAALPLSLAELYKGAELRDDFHCLEQLRASKTPEELNSIRRSFLRSSRAIARTLRYAKDCARNGTPLSEVSLSRTIQSEYGAEGARELSFKTISGFAENGAVIHYSTPSANKFAEKGQILLLDSGAYYEEGFATDCTRVVLFG
ncbi:MAG: M24 family metallopeptidase, partial [Silvanigrellaceae bacterium]